MSVNWIAGTRKKGLFIVHTIQRFSDVCDSNRRWKIHFHFHFVSFLVSFDNNKYKFAIVLFLGLDFWVFHHSLWHCSSCCYYSVAISFKNIRFNNITSHHNRIRWGWRENLWNNKWFVLYLISLFLSSIHTISQMNAEETENM